MSENPDLQKVAAEYVELTRRFAARVGELGLPDVSRFYWYHTVDLGNGLITPGLHDYRPTVSAFHFPEDMRGMKVLDVGSATGFFTFEFIRRGARVVSVELPTLRDLDRFPGQNVESSMAKIERMIFPDGLALESHRRGDRDDEMYRCLLEGPFRFCEKQLGLNVERRYCTIYDISPETIGESGFDLVFVGDVLLHLLYPLKALAAVSSVCGGALVVAQMLPEGPQEPPAMAWVGGTDPLEDEICWWLPNRSCIIQMLHKLGFPKVEETGWHTGILHPGAHIFNRAIFTARRS